MSRNLVESYDDWGCEEHMDDDICNDFLMAQFATVSELVDNEYTPFILLDGRINLWNRSVDVKGIKIFYNLDEFLKNLKDTDRLVIRVYDDGFIEIENHHHDGTNYYECQALNKWDKDDLVNFIEQNVSDELIKELIEDTSVENLSDISREKLIDFLEEIAE